MLYTERKLKSLLRDVQEKGAHGPKRFPVDQFFKEKDDQIWKNIPLFPGYQISDKGYVRTFKSNDAKYGYIIAYRKTSNGLIYNLSDGNGNSRIISQKDIKSMVDFNSGVKYKTFDQFIYNKKDKKLVKVDNSKKEQQVIQPIKFV